MFNESNEFILEDSFDEISFTFSEPEDQPKSIAVDLSNGSPLNPNDFIGVHYNINSLTALGRLDQLNHISRSLNLDYLVINESKLDTTIPSNLLQLDGFHEPVRSDRNRDGGGCLIYISKVLTFKRQSRNESKHFEHIWVDGRINDKIYSINAMYRPPNVENHDLFLEEVELILSKGASHKCDNFILASDLNFGNIYCKHPFLQPKPLDDSAPELFESFGFSQIIDIPTRVTKTTTSLIDLIFCLNIDSITCHGTLPQIADHDGTFVSFHCVKVKPKVKTRKVFDYKNLNENDLLEYIKNIDFEGIVFSKPVLQQADAITEILSSAFEKFVATKTVVIRSTDPPWVNSYTRLLLRKKNRNYAFFRKIKIQHESAVGKGNLSPEIVTRMLHKLDKAENKSKTASKESTKANRRAKQAFFNTVSSTMHNRNIPAKKKFSILSKLMKNNKVSHIPPIIDKEEVVTDPERKSNIFNEFFAEKATVEGADEPAPELPPRDDIFEKLGQINTSPIEVAKLCRDIKKSNSSHCGIPGKFLAIIATPISFPLYKIFNNLFDIGHFPDIFKIGHITALYKGDGLKSDKANYRGIHLLPTLSKIAESIIHARLLSHFQTNNIISERQAAYIKGDSTTQQLLYIVHLIKSSWTTGNITQGCFLDVSAAFDKCWINGLLAKLEQVKVEDKLLLLFKSYLSDRKICTVVDGSKSEFLDVKAGVPQGSRLGPLLWILYIQDIQDDLESECLLFADDTCLFVCGVDPGETAIILNRDLEKLGLWAKKWKVTFNAGKSKDMIFTPNKCLNSPGLILDAAYIKPVHFHKHLGLWLSADLDWEKHISYTCLRANGKLAVLRSVRFLDRATLDLLYKLTVRSVMEYAMVVYFNSLKQTQLRRLNQVQYRAAKLCTGALHFSSQAKLETDLSWESISDRAEFLGLSVFHKIRDFDTRPLIKKCMPPVEVKQRATRSTKLFVEHKFQRYQNVTFMNSFFPHFTKLYNKIEPSTRNLSNQDFKEKLKPIYKHKKVKHFSRGLSKWSNSLHTQLRVGRSYLAADGFAINLQDSNLCENCKPVPGHQRKSVPENSSHFFISCNKYVEERATLFAKISQYVKNFPNLTQKRQLEIILRGINLENVEPDSRNIGILFAVQKFIIQTKRFLPADDPITPPPLQPTPAPAQPPPNDPDPPLHLPPPPPLLADNF